jgi:hypothetical protein
MELVAAFQDPPPSNGQSYFAVKMPLVIARSQGHIDLDQRLRGRMRLQGASD